MTCVADVSLTSQSESPIHSRRSSPRMTATAIHTALAHPAAAMAMTSTGYSPLVDTVLVATTASAPPFLAAGTTTNVMDTAAALRPVLGWMTTPLLAVSMMIRMMPVLRLPGMTTRISRGHTDVPGLPEEITLLMIVVPIGNARASMIPVNCDRQTEALTCISSMAISKT